jgi:hypothetical protein
MRLTTLRTVPDIIAMASEPHLYSIVRMSPLKLMYAYCSRDMAYHHYQSIISHGISAAIVWRGMILRQH